jgi:uncharacterized protein YllA (UPF0747 family)
MRNILKPVVKKEHRLRQELTEIMEFRKVKSINEELEKRQAHFEAELNLLKSQIVYDERNDKIIKSLHLVGVIDAEGKLTNSIVEKLVIPNR